MVARPRGHKQQKWINMVIQFPLFVSSKPHFQAEFWYIESGLLRVCSFAKLCYFHWLIFLMDVYLIWLLIFQPILSLIFHKQNMHLQSKEKSVGNLWWNHCFIATFDYSYKLLDIHLAKINWLLMDFKILAKWKY